VGPQLVVTAYFRDPEFASVEEEFEKRGRRLVPAWAQPQRDGTSVTS
jgi:hypothetical protein